MVIDSIDNPNETAKKPEKLPLEDVLDDTLAREVDDDVARLQARDLKADSGNGGAPPDDDANNGNGGEPPDDDEPPTSRRMSPIPLGPQFAIRLGDGAMLMAVEGHADDRDLSGREVWTCFVLTPKEAKRARETMDHAEHAAASVIAFKLPRKP